MKLTFKGAKNLAVVLLAIATLSSCNKESGSTATDGKTKVVLNVSVGDTETSELKASSRSTSTSTSSASQQVEIPFSSNVTLVATLKPVTSSSRKVVKASSRTGLKAATTETDLTPGTEYTVLAYQADALVNSEVFTVGGENSFELAAGNYTFITYAAGSGATIAAPAEALSLAKFEALAASTDLMYSSTEQTISEGTTNTLNVVLKHLFTEITVNFNTSELGDATITSAAYSPSYPTAEVALVNGAVTGTGTVGSTAIAFPTGTTVGQDFTSEAVKVISSTTAGVITLNGVTIDGVTKDLSIPDLTVLPNYRYVLTLELKQKQAVELGGIEWSLGALIYDDATDSYSFAGNNEPGDYFFGGYVKPKNMDTSLPEGQLNRQRNVPEGVNGAQGDPCALVAPAGTWRLPLRSEIATLNAATEFGGSNYPSETNNYEPARYTAYYETVGGSTLGVFFGTFERPSDETKAAHFFVPFFGVYNNDFVLNNGGTEAHYLLKDGTDYADWFVAGSPNEIAWSNQIKTIEATQAVQVKCVKN